VVSAATIEKVRAMVRSYSARAQSGSALYWADKLVSLSSPCLPEDVCMLAGCLLAAEKYARCASLVVSKGLHTQHQGCLYLAAKALFSSGEVEEAGRLLEEGEAALGDMNCGEWAPSTQLLRGYIYEALDNRPAATQAFQAALKGDVFCYEAFDALVTHQLLTQEEERKLVAALPFQELEQCDRLASSLYSISLKKYASPDHLSIPSELEVIQDNADVQVCIAERLFYNCDHHAAFKITASVLKTDAYHCKALPVHIALLVELKKTNDLFKLAHNLVDLYPEWAMSWFAVGCYYYLIGKQDPARRFLSKATQLDRLFGAAWLAYGHSFAVESEHDQAMAAYFKANQLMQGCHLPLLYIGLEYSLTNNAELARTFLHQALSLAPHDPFVLHELGVTAFNNSEYEVAEKHLSDALLKVECMTKDGVTSGLADKWEALLNNLGHVCRKLGKYTEALEYHQQALTLQPLQPSTYSAIGYVQTLTGDHLSAVESFHVSLGIRREDTFSTAMLNTVIEQLMEEVAPFPGYPEERPRFQSVLKSANLTQSSEAGDRDRNNDTNQTNNSALSKTYDMSQTDPDTTKSITEVDMDQSS